MLSDVVQTDFACSRHRRTLFGPYLDGFLGDMAGSGYVKSVRGRRLRFITRFGEYLARRNVKGVSDIEPSHLDGFLRGERRRLAKVSKNPNLELSAERWAILSMVRYLEAENIRDPFPAPVEPPLLQEFYRALAEERGLSQSTIDGYRHSIDKLLLFLDPDDIRKSLFALTTGEIDRFVISVGRNLARRSMNALCSALRGFLRYLYRVGLTESDMSESVVMPQYYALERIPCALPWKIVTGLIDSVDASTMHGCRNRAILLLLVTYGVRPGEIVKLRLDDVDWRRNTIHFPRAKAGRTLAFPLTRDAGEAVYDYLRGWRPPVEHREIFLRTIAPYVPLGRGSVVSNIVRRVMVAADIQAVATGAGLIRHSLAVHLLREGHPLKTISDVLGHRDPHVVYQYTKLSLKDLHDVALPAKGVTP